MTMHKRRSLFVTGILLSVLVLFGSTTASAQISPNVFVTASFEAVALDHDSIRVRWGIDSTEADAANIEEFEIRYQEGTALDNAESFTSIDDIDEDDRSYVVNDLDHSTSYVFQVRALDPDADDAVDRRSVWAPAAGEVEETDEAFPPEQVDGLELVSGLNMMIMASWDEADTDSDFPLTGYELTIEPEDGPTDTMNIGVMMEYTFEGLVNDTEYTITVAARNEIGRGEPSEEKKATPGMTATPALPFFGAFALGAGLLALGRRRLRRRQQLLAS